MKKRNLFKDMTPYVLLLIVISVTMYIFSIKNVKIHDLSYNEFLTNLNNEKVEKIEVTPKNSESVYYLTGKLKGYSENETFKVVVPFTDSVIENVLDVASSQQLDVKTNKDPGSISWIAVVLNILPVVLLVGVSVWMVKALMGNGKGGSLDFGRSRAK